MPLPLHAQHTTVATQLAVGVANNLDTYLSPEKYRGAEFRLMSDVNRDSHKHTDRVYCLNHELAFAYLGNRTSNRNEYAAHYDFSYAMMHRWHFLDNALQLNAGAMTDVMLGFCYNSIGGNNPAQGYAALSLGATIKADYTFHALGRNLTIGYAMRMPFVGMMFSPQYGQSYYEIFTRGNYDHNIVFTSTATFQMRQQVTIALPVTNHTSLLIGYLCDIRQAKPNNLLQHHYYNAATIGVIIRK